MLISIRSSLLLLVLSVLLPGIIGVGLQIGSTYEAERAAHDRSLRETAHALSMALDGELAQRATLARLLAQSRWLDSAPAVPPEHLLQFEQQARRAMEGLDGWIELRAPGRVLLDTGLQTGIPPAADAPGSDDLILDRPQVRPLTATQDPQRAHATIVEPVVRAGRTLLNLVVTVRPAELQRLIDRQNLPPEWIGVVLDNHGMVVARHPSNIPFLGRSATPDLRAAVAKQSDGLFESVSLEGHRTVGFYSTSPQGWTFIVAMPRSQYAGSLPDAVKRLTLGALVLLGIAVAGALWVSRRIVVPVQRLKVAASRMQAGELVSAHPTGLVECDEVAGALAEASQTLRLGRANLEREVADAVERTRVAEQRVSQSQRVEALGRLTGGVAHDFNNLLGVISNSAHLIRRHAQTPELQLPVAATLRAVEAGSRLTQHLLRFAGRRPVRPQEVELARYLPELHELIHSVLGRQIKASVQVSPTVWPVRVDSSELELALINLVLNARDAMPGGGELRLCARNAGPEDTEGLPPRRYVLITVGDDGTAMPAEAAARAFEPFFTTKPVGKGTGLGLSQVHGFCVQAGGTARLDSRPGHGTTVSLLLPASGDGPVENEAPPPATPQPVIAGARVLLVEDNAELAAVTAALLQAHGAQVRRAADATEALQLLHTDGPVDVVLSDVVMPGPMDGVALARRLREEWPRLPVLLTSGYSANKSAMRDFVLLRKPCAPDDLLAALHRTLYPAAVADEPLRQGVPNDAAVGDAATSSTADRNLH